MIDQWIKEALRGGNTVVIDYPDGGFFKAKKEEEAFIKYSTGDCLYLTYMNGEYRIYQIDTHDGLHIFVSASSGD